MGHEKRSQEWSVQKKMLGQKKMDLVFFAPYSSQKKTTEGKFSKKSSLKKINLEIFIPCGCANPSRRKNKKLLHNF